VLIMLADFTDLLYEDDFEYEDGELYDEEEEE
jgi:hypothetical protein